MTETTEDFNTTPEGTQERVISKRTVTKGRKAVEKKNKALETLKIEYLPIDDITPNDYNPNRQSEDEFELLLRSMEEDGFTQPIVCVRHEDKVIIVDGEHRFRAAASLQYPEVPVVITDMTLEQARIATLRHNRARGSEDIELGAQVLRDLQELGALEWAQDSLMMDDVEIQKLLDDIPAPEALAGEEFNEGWEVMDDQDEGERRDGTGSSSMTAQALEKQRKIEKKVAEAKTEEERAQARKEMDVYRVSLVFSGEEAKIIRAVLAEEAAQKILDYCTAVYKDMSDEEKNED